MLMNDQCIVSAQDNGISFDFRPPAKTCLLTPAV